MFINYLLLLLFILLVSPLGRELLLTKLVLQGLKAVLEGSQGRHQNYPSGLLVVRKVLTWHKAAQLKIHFPASPETRRGHTSRVWPMGSKWT